MSIAKILPVVSGSTTLPTLDYDTLIAAGVHVPEFIEAGMDADFSFDTGDFNSLTSKTNSVLLDDTGKSLAYFDTTEKYMRLDSGAMNGLEGPTPDGRALTYAGVFQYQATDPSGSIQVLMQTSDDASVDGGEFCYFNSIGGVRVNVRGYGAQLSISHAEMVAAGISYDDWVFIGVSSRITSGDETEHTLVVGAANPISTTQSGTKVLSVPENTVAVGNAYTNTSTYFAMDTRVARFMSGAESKTAAEIVSLGKRAVVCAARRGVVVK